VSLARLIHRLIVATSNGCRTPLVSAVKTIVARSERNALLTVLQRRKLFAAKQLGSADFSPASRQLHRVKNPSSKAP
jgi:hypothetical protein